MKKVKFILAVALVLIATCIFAQDSTTVAVANTFLAPLEAKYPFIFTGLSIMAILSELLAYIPSVKANSVIQLIVGWIKALSAPKK